MNPQQTLHESIQNYKKVHAAASQAGIDAAVAAAIQNETTAQ